jgi:hypothetical protein
MRVRKEKTFYGATQKEAEALASPFVASANGKIFFSGPVLAMPIGKDDHKRPSRWQVDVEYYEDDGREPSA